jgi:hypothetical protein
MRRAAAAILVLAVVAAGCAGGDQRVTGVVVGVDGDLTTVRSFDVLTTTGERLTFVPGPDLFTFPDGTPLTHLSEHFQTGVPIRVTYRSEDGANVASIVEDAP